MRRRVGMADEADSKSVVGNHVWVQVPSPALLGRGRALYSMNTKLVFILGVFYKVYDLLWTFLFSMVVV